MIPRQIFSDPDIIATIKTLTTIEEHAKVSQSLLHIAICALKLFSIFYDTNPQILGQ